MQTRFYPARPTTPALAVPAQEPALHLLGDIWVASCPTCGYQLATARTQQRFEQRARRQRCPVCRLDPSVETTVVVADAFPASPPVGPLLPLR